MYSVLCYLVYPCYAPLYVPTTTFQRMYVAYCMFLHVINNMMHCNRLNYPTVEATKIMLYPP